MSGTINPEAAMPSTTQAFEQSDRNPAVTYLGGMTGDGGQMASPGGSESRVTPEAPAVSPNAGLKY
jgi:hypothetical protein